MPRASIAAGVLAEQTANGSARCGHGRQRAAPRAVFSIAFAALLAIACSTHEALEECLPPCGSADQTFFARCVADGLPDVCRAGNRMCCAQEAYCIGTLDDQVVTPIGPECRGTEEDQCWPACDESDAAQYDLCLGMGGSLCPVGDEECCALEADCLGVLGDLLVYAEGCCTDSNDCERGERCEPTTSLCVPASGCGDRVRSPDEECDDGNEVVEDCAYGAMSCVVCGLQCLEQPGRARFCGDGVVDSADGEDCDPPGTSACDPNCHTPMAPDCFNDTQDGNETDIDCGGVDCPACTAGQGCLVETDCEPVGLPECFAVADCDATGTCVEMDACDDGDDCTVDSCLPLEGCNSEMIDGDGDRFGPGALCGGDCDDTDPDIHPSAPELCSDGIDNNCDTFIDDIC